MGLNEWLALLGALGGLEAIRWGVTTWRNRKTDARKEDATADGMEIQNLLNVINTLTSQLDKSDERMKARDGKVDFTYTELRKAEMKILELTREKHELELKLKEAELKKCDVRGCQNRQPPSEY